MKNPWLSLWLSAANSFAGASRGFWSAEMQRQQKSLLNGMTQAATKPSSRPKSPSASKRRAATKRRPKG